MNSSKKLSFLAITIAAVSLLAPAASVANHESHTPVVVVKQAAKSCNCGHTGKCTCKHKKSCKRKVVVKESD